MPEAKGRSLLLRSFSAQSITDAYLEWLNNKHLMRFSRQCRYTHTRESCLAYLKTFEGSPSYFWSVLRQEDDLQVGTMTAYVDKYTGVADVGILMGHRKDNGRGYGKEAWGLALTYLFDVAGMRKVTAGTLETNIPMIKIAEYWTMKLEGIMREQEVVGSQLVNVHRFGILRSEWNSEMLKRRKDYQLVDMEAGV